MSKSEKALNIKDFLNLIPLMAAIWQHISGAARKEPHVFTQSQADHFFVLTPAPFGASETINLFDAFSSEKNIGVPHNITSAPKKASSQNPKRLRQKAVKNALAAIANIADRSTRRMFRRMPNTCEAKSRSKLRTQKARRIEPRKGEKAAPRRRMLAGRKPENIAAQSCAYARSEART